MNMTQTLIKQVGQKAGGQVPLPDHDLFLHKLLVDPNRDAQQYNAMVRAMKELDSQRGTDIYSDFINRENALYRTMERQYAMLSESDKRSIVQELPEEYAQATRRQTDYQFLSTEAVLMIWQTYINERNFRSPKVRAQWNAYLRNR